MRTSICFVVLWAGCANADLYEQAAHDRQACPYFEPEPTAARSPWAHDVSTDAIANEIERSFYVSPSPAQGLSRPELRTAIMAGLNIGYLLDDFDARPFTVTAVATEDHGAYVSHHVIVSDPFVTGFDVDYLVPAGDAGARPAVVGLHGHFDNGPVFLSSYLGVDLAERGYVVAAPTFRHMNCGDDERDQAIALMHDGFTLMGQRVYEALLTMKLVRSLDGVDPARLGLMGHSGGSSTANLIVRLSDWPAALVTDYEVEFRNTCGGQVHCETIPALLPLAGDINDQDTLAIPHLRIEYGYLVPEERDSALQLLTNSL